MRTATEMPGPQGVAHDSLSDLLRRFAYTQLPSRFHTLAQLGFPLAYQLWSWRWPRTAGCIATLSLFSLWVLAEQHLTGRSDSEVHPAPTHSTGRALWLFFRRLSASAGSLLTLALLLEAFAQIMATLFNCPGCAG